MVSDSPSSFENCFDQGARESAFAPGPLLLNSAYRAVFSRSLRLQLFQPSGRMQSEISVLRNVVAAKARQGRPRKVLISGDSAVILQCEKTKPNGVFSSVEAAGM